MNIEKIKKIKWQYLINRKESLLFHSLSDPSYYYFKKITGIEWKVDFILRFSDGSFYVGPKAISVFYKIFKNGSSQYYQNFKNKLIENIENVDLFTKKLGENDFRKFSDKELIDIFNDLTKNTIPARAFLQPMATLDKIISQKIIELLPVKSTIQKEEYLKILAYPEKKNEHAKEQESFLNLISEYNKNKNTENLIERHLQKYSWIGARYYWEYAWEKKDIIRRIDQFIKGGKDSKKEMRKIMEARKEMREKSERITKELRIKKNSELYKFIEIAREFSYLRTWRTDIIYQSAFRSRFLFYEIAKRFDIEKEDLYLYTHWELEKIIKKEKAKLSKEEINKRKEFYAEFVEGKDLKIFSGNKYKKYFSSFFRKENKEHEICGVTAHGGKTRGIVRIVNIDKDIKKVRRGDILVATMTFPNFVPAMEKASAFVTDEGGILCHAAIVSREMKKPCIIGTKIATQVLKNGDFVEVDANLGTVKILDRQKTLYLWDMCGTLFFEKWNEEKTGFPNVEAWITNKFKRKISAREYEQLWETYIKNDYLNLDIMPGFKKALELGMHNEVFTTGVLKTNDWRAEFLAPKIGFDFRKYFQKENSTFDYEETNIKTEEMLLDYLENKYEDGYRIIVYADDKLENIKEFIGAVRKVQIKNKDFFYRAYHILNDNSELRKEKEYFVSGNLINLVKNEKKYV